MSRIGKKAIKVPSSVTLTIGADIVTVKGDKGTMTLALPAGITAQLEGEQVLVARSGESQQERALHGTARSKLASAITGVSEGFQKTLELHGVGFRAALDGSLLSMNLGGAKAFEYHVPNGVQVTVQDNINIVVQGIDSQSVGEAAAEIRGFHPPEPYKGKGVRYQGEHVRRKAGKSVSA
jgi:large subunit ribosomal protein L6